MGSAIQQLLVHLDSSSRCAARLAVARQLAQQHQAALSALYSVTPSVIATPYVSEGSAAPWAGMQAIDDERRARARAAFEACMKQPGAAASWSDLTEFSAVATFAQQALYADLLVLGQHETS